VRPPARLPRSAGPVRSALLALPLLMLVSATSTVLAPAAAAAPAPRVLARSGVVVDAATGAVIWQRDAHRPTLVASTTKILTALVAEEAFPAGEVFTVPAAAEEVDGTRLGYRTGMRVRRHDLLTTLLLVSANDAAETLAGAYPRGGRAGFLAAMQEKADALGCTDSTWRDPSGLDAAGHRASAADLAIVGRALLARPELARIVATAWTRYRWPDGRIQVITNHNHLVSKGADPGAIGIKTGFTERAHSTIVAAERKGGRTLIAVALQTDDMYDDVRSMFAYGFATQASPRAEVLGSKPGSNSSSQGPTPLEPTPAQGGGQTPRTRQTPSTLAPVTNPILEHLLPAPLPILATAAVTLLVIGSVVTALSRSQRR
jgi:serine-type D-Ala-D-Ala carboxypeptidase (penicillin-binding protein 5/6)